MMLVLWSRFPTGLVPNSDIDSCKAGVRKINHVHPSKVNTVFNLPLAISY